MSDRKAQQIDLVLGQVLGERRGAMGIALKDLAARCAVSPQQILKYESGANRVSVSRLFSLAQALGTDATSLLVAVEARIKDASPPIQDEVEYAALHPLSSPPGKG